MAAPIIKLKRSAVEGKIPSTGNVPLGELALNTYDGYLYASKDVGAGVTVIAINPWRVGTGTDTYNTYFTQGNVGIGSENPTELLDVAGTIKIENLNVVGVSTLSSDINLSGNITSNVTLVSTDTGSAAAPEFKLYRNSSSPADADYLGQIKFAGESDTGVERNYAKITGKISDASNGTEDGIIEIAHIKAGSQNISGRWNSTTLQLLNGTSFSVAGDSTFTGDILANSDSTVDIGTNSTRFANVYADTYYGSASNMTGLTGASAATYGDASNVAQITVDSNGRITSIANVSISGGGGGISSVSEDTTPQLGGTLDTNGNLIQFGDSSGASDDRLQFGASQDLEIYHDGSNSFISDQGTGLLSIDSSFIRLRNAAGTSVLATFSPGTDSQGGSQLYYSGTKRFETTGAGVTVTGVCTATSFVKPGGTSSQFLKADGTVDSSSFLRSDADDTTTGDLIINTNTNSKHLYISRSGSTSQEYTRIGRDDTTTVFHTNNDESDSTVRFRFENTDTESGGGANANDRNIDFISDSTNARITIDGNTVWHAGNDGSGSGLDADTVDGVNSSSFLRSDAADQKTSGTLRFNDNVILALGSGDDAEFFVDGSHCYLDLNSGIGNFYIRDGTTTRFTFDDAGSFTATANVTAYSDITLKKNIELIPNALDKVLSLRGVTYNRIDIEDEPRHSGVIAQEVEEVLPEVVMTDEDGIKSVAYGNMVGLLIEAIKDQQDQINKLKEELEGLRK